MQEHGANLGIATNADGFFKEQKISEKVQTQNFFKSKDKQVEVEETPDATEVSNDEGSVNVTNEDVESESNYENPSEEMKQPETVEDVNSTDNLKSKDIFGDRTFLNKLFFS